jgi:hypothetical protein
VVAVHVVRLENAWFYERELAEARQLFASDGWSRGPLSGSSQIQDTADVDLLAIERGSNRVVGWAQLEATIGAERGEASPSLAGRLRSPAVFRISGFGILGGREGQRLSRAAAALLAGLQEFGLKANLEQLTLEANMLDLPALLDLGWNPDPLAPVLCSGAATTVPLTVDISEAALRRTRRLLGIVGPVVVRRKMRRVPASHTTSGSRIYH